MCGGGGGGGVSEQLAVQSANQEQERQNRINEGMRQLELMFNGGKRTTGQVGAGAAYDPNQKYYDRSGNAVQLQDPDTYLANNADEYAAQRGLVKDVNGGYGYYEQGGPEGEGRWVAQDVGAFAPPDRGRYMQDQFDKLAAGGLYTGVEDATGYSDEFFDKGYQAQLDYALPQVDRQYQDAQRQLQFALARQGLNASSQAGQLQADLSRERDLAIQGEQDKANSVRNKQRAAVEEERSALTQMLQQTGDVQSTMNAAAGRKSIIDAAPAIEEVGPLFQNATGALADMIVSPALRTQGGAGAKGYGSSKGSGKVVT